MVEERLFELNDTWINIISCAEQMLKNNEQSLRDLWESIKHSITHIVGIAEERRVSGTQGRCVSFIHL